MILMTKRLICVLAVLLLLCSPALAVYRGVLSAISPTNFTMTNVGGNPTAAAATICFVVPVGKHSSASDLVCHPLTAQPNGIPAQLTVVPPTGATRVAIDIDAPAGGGLVILSATQPQGAN